jgi:hypothetical protein
VAAAAHRQCEASCWAALATAQGWMVTRLESLHLAGGHRVGANLAGSQSLGEGVHLDEVATLVSASRGWPKSRYWGCPANLPTARPSGHWSR